MLNHLTKIVSKGKKRLGQGWSSGSGKYSGRGIKGQKAREGIKPLFEGGQNLLYKKLPMLRGKLRNKGRGLFFYPVNLEVLEKNPKVKNGSVIDEQFFAKKPVKILGKGKLTKKIIVKKLRASKQAQEKIKQAGGEYQI